MFTIEQKKLIVALQTSEKAKNRLIGCYDRPNYYHRCCLGVYAGVCGYKTDSENYKFIEFGGNYRSESAFRAYEKHFLYGTLGEFVQLQIQTDDCVIEQLSSLNDTNARNFDHKFISRFLFTMPQYVFSNFKKPEKLRTFCDSQSFVAHVESEAYLRQYDKIVDSWKYLNEIF